MSLESGAAADGVSDDFAGSADFPVDADGAAVGLAPEELPFLSGDEFLSGAGEHPIVTASTPAKIVAE